MRLGGVSEVATELGISPQRMRVLRTSDQSTFPEPIADLSAGPVWDLDEIARWKTGRPGPGRPPSTSLAARFDLDPDPIGIGGFADVYRASDRLRDGEVVAIKVLREPDKEDHAGRFVRELRILESIDHPNVIPVLASGVDRLDRPWYAMPLATGNLEDVLDAGLDESDITEIILQICEGLAYLHNIGDDHEGPIYHRDLCPSNVLRTADSTWAISDFGLAREAQRRTIALTKSSVIAGHIQYLAPEQLSSLKYAERPADLYSLGRTLQALVLGRTPNLLEPFEEPSPFRTVIRRATKSDARDRYATVEEFVHDLVEIRKAPDLWEGPPHVRMKRVLEKLKDAEPNSLAVLSEFSELVLDHHAELEGAAVVEGFTHLRGRDLDHLTGRLDVFRELIGVWSAIVREIGLPFETCDLVAQFGQDAISMSARDPDVLHDVIVALVNLGFRHNRWYVRDVVVDLLQRAQSRDDATTCITALRDCSPEATAWSLTAFARQSMHPIIRAELVPEVRP